MTRTPTFHSLLALVLNRGIRVEWVRMVNGFAGACDLRTQTIYLAHDLDNRPRHAVSVLAHELGHLHYRHGCLQSDSGERAADEFAADLLISPDAYERAERLHGANVPALAVELGVTQALVGAHRARLAVSRDTAWADLDGFVVACH